MWAVASGSAELIADLLLCPWEAGNNNYIGLKL